MSCARGENSGATMLLAAASATGPGCAAPSRSSLPPLGWAVGAWVSLARLIICRGAAASGAAGRGVHFTPSCPNPTPRQQWEKQTPATFALAAKKSARYSVRRIARSRCFLAFGREPQVLDPLIVVDDDAELAHEELLRRLGQRPFQRVAVAAGDLCDGALTVCQQRRLATSVALGGQRGRRRVRLERRTGLPPRRRTSSASSYAARASPAALLRASARMVCVPDRRLHARSFARVSRVS